MREFLELPIDKHIPDILNKVEKHSTVIVKASPGSGKTTRLPYALARTLGKKVVVLEPRRLAAKLAAQRIADEQNLTLGNEIGYQFRFEKMVSANTQVLFYTEGTFLRKFISDPFIKDIDIVILDEFHERHLETDLALAILRELQTKRDLKIILMSATIDTKLSDSFQNSASVDIEAPMYPVEITFLPNQPSILNEPLETKVRKALEKSSEGNALVFLPGMREMLRTKDALHNYNVHLLHADLSKEEQAKTIEPSPLRKVILATNIAESSVTIPGITIVIDSGIQREAHYSPWNGLKFIEDTPITKSSAIQRTGRAGRTTPGICHRLYSQQDFNEREEFTIPEIERADLTDTLLLTKAATLTPRWFHPPHPEKWKKAEELLTKLGALANGELTAVGQKIFSYPLEARLARMLIDGENLSQNSKSKLLSYICEEIENDRTGSLKRRLHTYLKNEGTDNSPWEKSILTGMPDQVAKFRKKQRDFIHYSGRIIKAHHSLQDVEEGHYIILDITQKQEAIKILPIEESWLWEMDPFPFTEEDEVVIQEKIAIRRMTKYGSIVIEETTIKPDWIQLPETTKAKILALSESTKNKKIAECKEQPEFERLSYLAKIQNQNTDEILEAVTLNDYFKSSLSWEEFPAYLLSVLQEKLDVSNLERLLPQKINLGGRRELTVNYPVNMEPYLEAPIQDFYGIQETPHILNGKIPLLLKLLGPHKRPIQVTKDLKNFWQKTYQEMKKEYQRDYPRHYWPDKPWEAKPILLKSQLPKV